MPDTRSHRGAHPEDATLFGPDQQPTLRSALHDLCWLLDRRYALRSALTLVGDRHALTQRQRLALARAACSAEARERRLARRIPPHELARRELWIDGYNVLITVEAALGGGVVLHGRDGCFRDLASLHGTYRKVAETEPAIELVGATLAALQVAHCRWILDRPVSNSGRLKTRLTETAARRGWSWQVDLEFSPDAVLSQCAAIVATSDSAVLDRCHQWADLARHIVTAHVPSAFVVELGG